MTPRRIRRRKRTRPPLSAPRGMVSSVWWSSVFGYVMLIGFLFLIPDMNDAAKQGWNVFFWALDHAFPGLAEGRALCRDLRLAIPLRPCDGDFRVAHDLRLRARRRPAGLELPEEGEPRSPHADGGDLDGRDPRCSVRLGRLAGHDRRRLGLFDRRLLHGHLPVLLLRGPDRAGARRLRQDLDEDGAVGSRRAPVQARRGAGSILSALLIFFIGVQPPNGWALWITVGFIVLAGIVWVAFEQRRFQGPPIGDMIAKRQAEIAAAEKAVGEV